MENTNGQAASGKPSPDYYSPDAVMARIKNNAGQAQETPLQLPGWVVPLVLAAIVGGLWYGYSRLGEVDIPLCVINTSSDAPMIIKLDRKTIGKASRMVSEDPKAAVMGVLKPGKHKLEAQDAAGKVLASDELTVEEGCHGFLWAPLSDPSVKFTIQTTYYGEGVGGDTYQSLGGSGPLWALPEWVTQWLRDNPKTVSVPKGWKSTSERALRMTTVPQKK